MARWVQRHFFRTEGFVHHFSRCFGGTYTLVVLFCHNYSPDFSPAISAVLCNKRLMMTKLPLCSTPFRHPLFQDDCDHPCLFLDPYFLLSIHTHLYAATMHFPILRSDGELTAIRPAPRPTQPSRCVCLTLDPAIKWRLWPSLRVIDRLWATFTPLPFPFHHQVNSFSTLDSSLLSYIMFSHSFLPPASQSYISLSFILSCSSHLVLPLSLSFFLTCDCDCLACVGCVSFSVL